MKTSTIILSLLVLFIFGTFGGNSGGLPPYKVRKTSPSIGLIIAYKSTFSQDSKHIGANISFKTRSKSNSKYFGLNIGVFKSFEKESTLNGINISIVNKVEEKNPGGILNGIEIGLLNFASIRLDYPIERKINGLQIGLINESKGYCVQLGAYNRILMDNGEIRESIGVNWYFGEKFEKSGFFFLIQLILIFLFIYLIFLVIQNKKSKAKKKE